MAKNEYDLIVIGLGGAGSNAATTAANMGKRIALIECDKLGGTCLNYGCDPIKRFYTQHICFTIHGVPPRWVYVSHKPKPIG